MLRLIKLVADDSGADGTEGLPVDRSLVYASFSIYRYVSVSETSPSRHTTLTLSIHSIRESFPLLFKSLSYLSIPFSFRFTTPLFLTLAPLFSFSFLSLFYFFIRRAKVRIINIIIIKHITHLSREKIVS